MRAFSQVPLSGSEDRDARCRILMRLNRLESRLLIIYEGIWGNCVLVVSRKGEREHTREGVWKSLSSRLQCIWIQKF